MRKGRKMMTGRERVYAALDFKTPDRAPRDLWALPYISLFQQRELDELLAQYPCDIGRPQLSPGSASESLANLSQVGQYHDEWGSLWQIAEPGIIGEVKVPALADWSALASYQPPWSLVRDQDLSEIDRSCAASDLFMVSGVCARPFERLQFVRGSENVFMELADGTRKLRTLLDMIHAFYMEEVENWTRTDVDAVMLMDDWGSSRSLLIHPDMWRQIFKPLYKDYCDLIHAAGKRVFFHSDGQIEAIYADLIEVGVDALNSQLFCMNIEELGRRYRGQITFWGEIDRQHVLPFGDTEEVRSAVQRVRSALDDGTGGVIAQCEWGKENKSENIAEVFSAWLE
jgi:uroporphyrinogen decarboxylase